MALKDFISRFNDNDLEFLNAFGGSDYDEEWDRIRRFLKLLENRELIKYIHVGDRSFNDFYTQNIFDRYCFRRPELRDDFIHYSASQFYRNISYDNGRIYLVLSDLQDLAQLFNQGDSRYTASSYDLALSILGEDIFEPYTDTTSDVYDDVISVLTKPNFKKLCQLISQGREPIIISDYSDEIYSTLIPELSVELGDENILNFDDVVVETMLKDKDTFKFLSREVLGDDFYYSLFQCHGNAYNGVLVGEWYNKVWSEIKSFGIGEGVWTKNAKDKNIYQIDITDNFIDLLGKFFDVILGYNVRISDFSDYFSFVLDIDDRGGDLLITLRLSEYPDHREVNKYINESIFDYVEF
jgi:hypothetical protein